MNPRPAEALALKSAGFVFGVHSLGPAGTAKNTSGKNAANLALEISAALKKEGKALDPDLRDFLKGSHRLFEALGKISDSVRSDRRVNVVSGQVMDPDARAIWSRPVFEENPAWAARRTEIIQQSGLTAKAGALHDKLWAKAADNAIGETKLRVSLAQQEDPLLALRREFGRL